MPQCAPENASKCSPYYHDQEQTPAVATPTSPHPDGTCSASGCDSGMNPTGEYLFDHRNESLRQWILDELIDGKTGMGDPAISGGFANDAQGICCVWWWRWRRWRWCAYTCARGRHVRCTFFLVAHFENLPFSGVWVLVAFAQFERVHSNTQRLLHRRLLVFRLTLQREQQQSVRVPLRGPGSRCY